MALPRTRLVLGLAVVLAASGAQAGPDDLLRLQVRRGSGPPVALGEVLGGGPAVVNLWATYCAPCRAEVPALRAAARRWRARGVRIVGVALDADEPALVARAVREWGIDYDVFRIGEDQETAVKALLPAGLPTTFLVGARGIRRHDRFLTEDDLDRLITAELAGDGSAGARGP